MTIQSPDERSDLYDAYDLPENPRRFLAQHWMDNCARNNLARAMTRRWIDSGRTR